MDHKDLAKPGGGASNHPHNQNSVDSKQHQHVAYLTQQQDNNAFYGVNPTQPSYDGSKNPGFVGLEVNNLPFPYNPYPPPYVIQQVQGQGYPMVHHAVSQDAHHTFPDPPPQYMQQHLLTQQPTQRVIIRGVSHKSSYCSWRMFMVGVLFTLLALKLILACVWKV